jgi:hypothetical protein
MTAGPPWIYDGAITWSNGTKWHKQQRTGIKFDVNSLPLDAASSIPASRRDAVSFYTSRTAANSAPAAGGETADARAMLSLRRRMAQ